jgi:hypothetical protein
MRTTLIRSEDENQVLRLMFFMIPHFLFFCHGRLTQYVRATESDLYWTAITTITTLSRSLSSCVINIQNDMIYIHFVSFALLSNAMVQ